MRSRPVPWPDNSVSSVNKSWLDFGRLSAGQFSFRPKVRLSPKLRNEQAGYRQGRNTTEQIFVLRNIIEQVIEWNSNLYICFVDFEKAFDSVHRETLWKLLKICGIPDKLVNMIKTMYRNSKCAVIDRIETSQWFDVKSGVKQGCVISGLLFLIVMDWIMT